MYSENRNDFNLKQLGTVFLSWIKNFTINFKINFIEIDFASNHPGTQ